MNDNATTKTGAVCGFNADSVLFITELAQHTKDKAWHDKNRLRFEEAAKSPMSRLVEGIRERYINALNLEVGSGSRKLSILKKNDYGQGGYYPHYWFAFYDPPATSKTKSCQLYLLLSGEEQECRYGFSTGDNAEAYRDSLITAILDKPEAVAEYMRSAPRGTLVWLSGEEGKSLTADEWIRTLTNQPDRTLGVGAPLVELSISQQFPLKELPQHDPNIVCEVGTFFTWAWPFFLASCTGVWNTGGAAFPGNANGAARRDAGVAARRTFAGNRFWAISLGHRGKYWDECYRDGLAVVNAELGDLRNYPTKEAFSEALRKQSGRDSDPVNDALMCYQFCYEMRAGDHVVAKIGRETVLGMGTVTSDYIWDETREAYKDVRRVRWLSSGKLALPEALQVPLKTLTDISDCRATIDYITKHLPPDTDDGAAGQIEPYTVEDALDGLFVPPSEFVSLLADWRRKKNAILQGPPGVGKTFIAKRLAYALIEAKDASRVEMVQFHQSYAYEDFVQGWRPKEEGGFYLKHGIFYNFCRRAAADPARRYVFIIDEINRGNLSRILGELMFLIEPDHRGEAFAIPLTYSKNADERFCVSENVYVLGMMNTADRSLSMVDYALRRRFCFTQLQPAYSTPEFKQFLADRVSPSLIEHIVDRMTVLNGQISKDKNLGRGFEIGHSFFCPIDGELSLDGAWYEAVIKREIAPLVREYWFDDLENAEKLIADLLK